MDKKSKKTRVNSFLNKEYFKIICLADTKDQTEAFSQYFTGSTVSQRGVYNCSYNKTQIITFPRYVSKLDHQATTVAVEGLIIYLEKEEEFPEIKGILSRYSQVPVRVMVSDFDATHLANEIQAAWLKKPEDPVELRDYMNKCDIAEFTKIKEAFETYDKDGSGSIDNNEMTQIAVSMGEDADNEDFKKSMYALDLNQDGSISLREFIAWWKIGRQNTIALPKIYDLFHSARDLVDKIFNLSEFTKDVNHIEEEQTNQVSTQRLLFRSPGVYKIKTFMECSMAIGGEKRLEMTQDFLYQFTKNKSTANTNWISILIPLNKKQKKLDHNRAKFLIDEFKDNCIKWGEENTNFSFISFIKNLLVFESNSSENSVILAVRLKLDIEELVKSSLQHFLYLFDNLQPKKESTWFNFKTHSNLDLYEAIKREVTLGEFFDISELILEGSTFRERMKACFLSLNPSYRESLGLLQFFFQPYNVNIELDCNLNEMVDKLTKNVLDMKLSNFGFVLDFIKKNLSKELLASADNFEIGVNYFDVFGRFRLFTQSTFCEKTNINEDVDG